MSDTKVSAESAATTLTGTELLLGVQSGANVKITPDQIAVRAYTKGGTLGAPINDAAQVTLASGATVNIGAAGSNTISISGTTTITAFDTIASGALRRLVFAGVLILTHNATSLILPSGANITTAAGDVAFFESLGSGNWRCVAYQRASGAALVASAFTGGTLTSALNEAQAVTIASSTTPAIFAAAGNTINLTGTVTVTGFDTIAAGAVRRVIFGGILQLTYNATSMQNLTAANITTAAGDVAEFESLGSGNTKMLSYTKADGTALVASSFVGGTLTGALNEAPPVTLASAATMNIGAAAANTINISGTTTITALDTIAAGAIRCLKFAGALTLTYNATSLILPGSANITTAANDCAFFESLGSGNWICIGYQKADGTSLATAVVPVSKGGSGQTVTALSISSGVVAIDLSLGNFFTLALSANVTSFTFSNTPGSGKGFSIWIEIVQNASAAKTVTLSGFKWAGGIGSTAVSTALSAVDELALTSVDNGSTLKATLAKAWA